jgi:hypothetical protein
MFVMSNQNMQYDFINLQSWNWTVIVLIYIVMTFGQLIISN